MELSKLKWLNWVGFLLFAFGLVLGMPWYSIPDIDVYAPAFMGAGSLIAFIFGRAIAWLGLAIGGFAYAWFAGYITIALDGVTFSPLWIWLSGYLLSFFSEK